MILKLTRMMDYLNDPRLVASIQQFFGVKIYHNRHDEMFQEDNKIYTYAKIDDNEGNYISTCHNEKMNGCNVKSKQLNARTKRMHPLEQKTNEPMVQHQEALTVSNNPNYTNPFWHYAFLFGTELGDEIFYSTFIPFLFWNIDGAVGRRVVLVWAIIMTIGQILKDVLRWPRPACPPVIRLQNKWSQEYGMPSTHAMSGLSIPLSVVLFTKNKYIYSPSIGYIVAILWCALVSTSRLYLGMHTVLDIVAGLVLTIALMIPLVPLVDITNSYVVTNFWPIIILTTISIAVILYYPSSNKWTPTRSDTAMVISVAAGLQAGAWLNYYTGLLRASQSSPPFYIIWPTYSMLGRSIIRTILGFAGILVTKTFCKFFSYIITCGILQIDWRKLMQSQDYNGNQNKVFVDLVYRYVSCFLIGVNIVYLFPQIFNMIGIERPAFYMEI